MDLIGLQEPVFFAPVIDEGRLEGRFHMGHDPLVNISSNLLLGGGFNIKFLQEPVFYQGHPVFLRVDGVDQ